LRRPARSRPFFFSVGFHSFIALNKRLEHPDQPDGVGRQWLEKRGVGRLDHDNRLAGQIATGPRDHDRLGARILGVIDPFDQGSRLQRAQDLRRGHRIDAR
jgi:hypothetical protein